MYIRTYKRAYVQASSTRKCQSESKWFAAKEQETLKHTSTHPSYRWSGHTWGTIDSHSVVVVRRDLIQAGRPSWVTVDAWSLSCVCVRVCVCVCTHVF